MNPITTNPEPKMTRHLAATSALLREHPLVVVDVGARWGFNKEWEVFGDCLRVYCFEPDEAECARLNAAAASNVTYIPHALAAKAGTARLYEAKVSASTSLYRSNMEFFSRLLNRDNAEIVAEHKISVTTLDDAMHKQGVASVDFLKVDVEGAELEVLQGGERCLKSPSLLGVLSEFRFQEEINGSPVFWQLDQHVRPFGFRLFGMQFTHQSRRALPYESAGDYRTPEGKRFFAYTKHGQIMDGDALYFRDLMIPANREIRAAAGAAQILKAAALFEIYTLSDCAAELIVANRPLLEPHVKCDELLDLLTPRMWGCKVPYRTYVDAYLDENAPLPFDVRLSRMVSKSILLRAIRKLVRLAARLTTAAPR